MNIVRTIQKNEGQPRIDWLFGNQNSGNANPPCNPPIFPLPFKLKQTIAGGFLYLVYDGQVRGYSKITRVYPHSGELVGSQAQFVQPGDAIEIQRPMVRMPFRLVRRGFTGIRYLPSDLHTLSHMAAQKIVSLL